jgi:hypothetical protein
MRRLDARLAACLEKMLKTLVIERKNHLLALFMYKLL